MSLPLSHNHPIYLYMLVPSLYVRGHISASDQRCQKPRSVCGLHYLKVSSVLIVFLSTLTF